jgi:hypothetical protein
MSHAPMTRSTSVMKSVPGRSVSTSMKTSPSPYLSASSL